MTMSEVSDMGEGIGLQAFGPDRDGHRFLRATEGAGSRPSPIGDSSSVGHLAAVSPGRHAVAQSEGHRKVSGSTLRRHLEQWAGMGVLAQVHAVLVGMLRGDPTLILDTCSVRAKRGSVRSRANAQNVVGRQSL